MRTTLVLSILALLAMSTAIWAQQTQKSGNKEKAPVSSYMPVVETETFDAVRKRMEGAKAGIEKKQADLLNERYDLSDKPANGVTMSRGKAVQEGVAGEARHPASLGIRWRACRRPKSRRRRLIPEGLPAAAAPESSGRGHALSEVSHRRDQEAGSSAT